MKQILKLRSFLALLAILGVIAAACSDGAGGSEDLSITVTAPADGATVGDEFQVNANTSVPIGEPDTGRHHIHLYFDGETAEGDYDIVYDVPFTVTRSLSPGEHTVEAVIANADHSTTEARQEFTVTVQPGAGDGAGGGSGGGSGDGGPAPSTSPPPVISDDSPSRPGY